MITKQFTLKNFSETKPFTDAWNALKGLIPDTHNLECEENAIYISPKNTGFCEVCGDKLYRQRNHKKAPVTLSMYGVAVRIVDLECKSKSCKHKITVKENVFDKLISKTVKMTDNLILLLSEAKVPDQSISRILKQGMGIGLSRTAIANRRNAILEEVDLVIQPPDSESWIEYDEQVVKHNGIENMRIVLKKNGSPVPFYDKTHPDATKETIRRILMNIPELENTPGFVMDMAPRYPDLFKELFPKAYLQWCLFHLNQLIFKETKKAISIGRRTFWTLQVISDLYRLLDIFYVRITELEWIYEAQKRLQRLKEYLKEKKLTAKETQESVEEFERTLIKEFWQFNKELKLARRKSKKNLTLRTEEEAREKLDKYTKTQGQFALKEMQKRIGYISQNFDKFTSCLCRKKAPPTNNGMESYFSSTLQKKAKKDFRSKTAIAQQILLSQLRKIGQLITNHLSMFDLIKDWASILMLAT